MADFNDYNRSWMAADSEFDTTEWTQILGASLSKEVMGELYKKYRKPVYLYLRSKGFADDTARDLIQGFFTEKILGKQLLQKADPHKGKFRAFLLTAIRNYTIDIKRSEKPTVAFDHEKHDPYASDDDPALAFNQAWAIQLVQDTVAELEDECLKQGKNQDWDARAVQAVVLVSEFQTTPCLVNRVHLKMYKGQIPQKKRWTISK